MRRENRIPEFWVQYDHFYKIIFGVIVYYIYIYVSYVQMIKVLLEIRTAF